MARVDRPAHGITLVESGLKPFLEARDQDSLGDSGPIGPQNCGGLWAGTQEDGRAHQRLRHADGPEEAGGPGPGHGRHLCGRRQGKGIGEQPRSAQDQPLGGCC